MQFLYHFLFRLFDTQLLKASNSFLQESLFMLLYVARTQFP